MYIPPSPPTCPLKRRKVLRTDASVSTMEAPNESSRDVKSLREDPVLAAAKRPRTGEGVNKIGKFI